MRGPPRPAALTCAVFLAAAVPGSLAYGQAYQCSAGETRLSVPPAKADGPVRNIPVTGYTLALSWSPEFCRTRARQTAHRHQCSGDHGRFGLILHGLWPEGAGDRWPQWCRKVAPPPPATLHQHFCMTPSPRLMGHEWAKHGSCMARRPEGYFNVAAILWNSLQWPDYDRLSRDRKLTAGAVRGAFVVANPGWNAEHIGLRLNDKGWLTEIRLCYARDFLPTRCTPRQFGPRDGTTVRIWRGL